MSKQGDVPRKTGDLTPRLAVLFALLCLALAIRLPGYDGRPLWIDELWRVLRILDPHYLHDYFFAPNDQNSTIPPLYALMVTLASFLSVSPDTLRLSSLVPGLAAVFLAFALTRKAGGSLALATLCGLLFAANESFIAFSNEMKNYMFEVCVHLSCLYTWLALIPSGQQSARKWLGFFLMTTLAIFSTPTIIFPLPAFGASLLWRFWRNKDWRNIRRGLMVFAGLAALILGSYFMTWRHGDSHDMLSYWAAGFHAPGQNYLVFAASRMLEIWRASFTVFPHWPVPALALALLASLILYLAIRRRAGALAYDVLVFYLVLLATLFAVNALQIWPLGALRPNLFLYGYVIFLLFFPATQVSLSRRGSQFLIACAVLVMAWQMSAAGKRQALIARLHDMSPPIERSDLVAEDFSSRGRLGKAIEADCPKARTALVFDTFMTDAMTYYVTYDSAHHSEMAPLRDGCAQWIVYEDAYRYPRGDAETALAEKLKTVPEAWFLYSHLAVQEADVQREIAAHFGTVTQSTEYPGAGYFHLTVHSQ